MLFFQNESKRELSPGSTVIPTPALNVFFNGGISSYHHKFMQKTPEEIDKFLNRIQVNFTRTHSNIERQALWLMIAFSYPDASNELLTRVGSQLCLTLSEQCLLAAVIDNHSFFDHLMRLAGDEVQDVIDTENYFYAFIYTAGNNNRDFMEHLVRNLNVVVPEKLQAMLEAQEYHAFRWASENGHITMMERLIELSPDKVLDMVSARDYHSFYFAVGNRQPKSMAFLIELMPDKVQDMLSAHHSGARSWAEQNGDQDIVERLDALAQQIERPSLP